MVVVKRSRLEWFKYMKIRDKTENKRTVAEMKIGGSALEGDLG